MEKLFETFDIGNQKSQINDIKSAMSPELIDDYSVIPVERYNDWKLLVKLNDRPSRYTNMLSFEQRQTLLKHIKNWELSHRFI